VGVFLSSEIIDERAGISIPVNRGFNLSPSLNILQKEIASMMKEVHEINEREGISFLSGKQLNAFKVWVRENVRWR